MKSLCIHGGLFEIAQDLTGLQLDGMLEGEVLSKVAGKMKDWMHGPTFLNDCRLSGLNVEHTRRVVIEIRECAVDNEPVIL